MDPRTGWDAGAQAWTHFVRSGADYYRALVHGPALLAACEPCRGLNALDIGCGEGYFSRALATAGARVVGIDFSPEQLGYARQEEERNPLGIIYEVLDAHELISRWPPRSYDLVTACMSIQDMADAPRVLRQAASMLREAGRLVFSVPHPATDTACREWERDEKGRKLALKVDRYFDTGESVMHWTMPRLLYQWSTPHWRHTLEEWSTLLLDAGLQLRRLIEPRPGAETVALNPALDDCARLPYFLIFDTFVV